MKLDPGFPNHWKTERLIADLGAEGVVAVLRLWGNAQIRREFSGLKFTPRRLAMETKWFGDENQLFDVLTDPDSPWLDPEEGGTWAIHGFAEHQHQVIKLWENGRKGGRPKKTSTSSSPSPSPICEPNGNQMVSPPAPMGEEGFPKTPADPPPVKPPPIEGLELPFESIEFAAAWAAWKKQRSEIKKKLTPTIAAIEHTIE
ncbi:MAG: hypothetical protein K9N23_10480 [Akkermansiaceae bacterium]|nr:hypothetical protein [Akkermansiaceae bacterium]